MEESKSDIWNSEMKKYCDTEMYLCDICNNVFKDVYQLINHNVLEHGLQENKITYDCANCYRSFKERLLFKEHLSQKESSNTLSGLNENMNRNHKSKNKVLNHHGTPSLY